MARVRKIPRGAPRHSGRQWGRGAQYSFDEYFPIEFGPWKAVASDPFMGSYQKFLTDTGEARVQNGKIGFSLLDSTASYSTPDVILGMFTLFVNNKEYGIVFYEDTATGNIKVETFDGTTTTTNTSSDSSNGEKIHAVPWGDKIYCIQEGSNTSIGGRTLIYDVSSDTFTHSAFTGSDPAELVFILDNNLVVVTDGSSDAVYIYWTVDSSMEDFTGIGSGSNPVSAKLGEVRGWGLIDNGAIIFFEFGAVRMRSTGTLPAFQFDTLDDFAGCPQAGAVVSDGSKVFFLDRQGFVRVTRGADPQIIGSQPSRLDITATTSLHHSKESGLVIATQSGAQIMIEPTGPEIVGYTTSPMVKQVMTRMLSNLTGSGDIIATVDVGDSSWDKLLYTDGSEPTPAGPGIDIYTPYVNTGTDIEVLYLDIFTTHPNEPRVRQVVFEDYRNGTMSAVVGKKVEDHGMFKRYELHAISPVFRMKIVLKPMVFSEGRGVTKVVLQAKTVGKDAKGRMYG